MWFVISSRRHPKKEIAAALGRLDGVGFESVEDHNGHRWGWVVCRECGERLRVHSTPRNPGVEAKRIDQFAARHLTHRNNEDLI